MVDIFGERILLIKQRLYKFINLNFKSEKQEHAAQVPAALVYFILGVLKAPVLLLTTFVCLVVFFIQSLPQAVTGLEQR